MVLRSRTRAIFIVVATIYVAACSSSTPPPRVAPQLDVARYMGTWHEIARLPFDYADDCFGASADYEQQSDLEFRITNYCWYRSFFGPMRKAEARAQIPDPTVPAKIEVRPFWRVTKDYWILHVSDDYQHALVGTPDRKYLWILSRGFSMDGATYAALVELARIEGYDVERLIRNSRKKNLERQAAGGPGEVRQP